MENKISDIKSVIVKVNDEQMLGLEKALFEYLGMRDMFKSYVQREIIDYHHETMNDFINEYIKKYYYYTIYSETLIKQIIKETNKIELNEYMWEADFDNKTIIFNPRG